MARVRSPNRDKAYEIYKEYNGNIDLVKIASILGISPGTVRGWKNKDSWESQLNGTLHNNKERSKKKKGGQPGNKNATGPPRNKNAEKFGFFSKYMPEETLDLMKEISQKNQLDILWEQITIQYAAIIRAQRIMYVEKKDEMIKELKKEETSEYGQKIEYEFQFAWDRQATFLNAQSRAMGELRSLIKQYESMVNANWDLITEEQKSRLDLIKAQTNKLTGDNQEIEDTSDIESEIYGN
ncbi:phage terminase small subunit [Paraclostridium sordellii]|uniref:phage terminase small subunit n=1 Tax=Paraclostridium sordellii TaxID=1505 RepID=UPI0005DACCD9|nr:phage terminase small subunit [Paeniclostridium sordellii]CEP83987.1 phage-related terminase small subunit-like protein [[Clostridium] sordellii] [Paeniclostridium sordellii]